MSKATVKVDHQTEGLTKACSIALIRVEIPGLGRTGYRVGSDSITPELLEEYRQRGEKEIQEVIKKYSVTRGQGIKDDEYIETSLEGTGEESEAACG